jgi:hypothetical protein
LGGVVVAAQKHRKIYKYLKRDTFELKFAVDLTFNKTQPNSSVQTDEKHNQ